MSASKPSTMEDVLELLDAGVASAALGAAMELGLFWLLEDRPLDARGVARALGIPAPRCRYWLQMLCQAGLLQEGAEGFEPSASARTGILEVYRQQSWALLAREARERLPALGNLPTHLQGPGSVWNALGLPAPMYLDQMAEDVERARQFTRMLYEIHRSLAEDLAGYLDLSGVDRLMDLGGGSGVVSMALARRHPRLSATVVDIATVCAAGREIAAESSMADRITYHPADFLEDDLPSGFDVVLECDVNVYGEALFRKIRDSLIPGGRFVIVDQLAPAEGVAPPTRVHWALLGALERPDFAFPTAARIQHQLETAGFHLVSAEPLPPAPGSTTRFTRQLTVLQGVR